MGGAAGGGADWVQPASNNPRRQAIPIDRTFLLHLQSLRLLSCS